MPRNITATQKLAQDFFKSNTLAQANQYSMTFFFLPMSQKTPKKNSEDLKVENKNPGHAFLNFILLFNIAVEKV